MQSHFRLVAVAAALAVLEAFDEEKLLERSRAVGARVRLDRGAARRQRDGEHRAAARGHLRKGPAQAVIGVEAHGDVVVARHKNLP